MFGWCFKCGAVALEGVCSKHGKTIPISAINSVDIRPLTELEKKLINERSDALKLEDGIFLVYGDRMYRRKVVVLDKPILELKLLKDDIHVKPLIKGKIQGMSIESITTANENRINRLVSVARAFAEWELNDCKNAVISFSGGKDSVVLSHILAPFNLRKVFIDTTIEFPETYLFIRELNNKGWAIDITKASRSFFTLLKEKGYPSYKNRWCCKTQKLYPFATYIKRKFGDEEIKVFSAERRWEALSRMDQPLRKKHKHIKNQDTIQPLLDWLTMDVWIYIWANKLPINQLYRYYHRGGCWVCPFGLKYRIFLMQFAHPKLYNFLKEIGAVSKSYNVSIYPCLDGKPMRHLVFADRNFMNEVAKLLPNICSAFEVHVDQKTICVPSFISERKLKSLIKEVKINFKRRASKR